MKNKKVVTFLPIAFFSLTVGVVLLSWVGSLNEWGPVQSLLSEEGIRWELNHIISDYVQTPALGIILVMLMGMGIACQGGLWEVVKHGCCSSKKWSGKERRSLTLAVLAGLIYILLVCLSVPLLKSVTGSLLYSPFQKGFFYILSFGIGLMGLVYGFASNRFRNVSQVVDGMSRLISSESGYFVTLFFVVQFFSVLDYTHLPEWIGINATTIDVLFQICCYLPILLSFFKKKL